MSRGRGAFVNFVRQSHLEGDVVKYRILFSIVLALAVLAVGGLWTLSLLPRARPEAPLEVAAAGGSPEELRRELRLSRDVNGKDPRGFTALDWAARTGRTEAVAELVRAGADPDLRDSGPNGWTPLLHAVHKNQLGSVRALIAAGADPAAAAPNGITPLMLAASQSEPEIVDELLAAGADPRARQPGGETVLTHAVIGGDARIVKALLDKAPDLRQGDTWEDWAGRFFARLRGRKDVIALLDRQEDAR
jgi:ankyrin repeat protein